MKLGMEVGLSPGHIVLNGDPAPPKGAQSAQFSAHVHCGQTAGWINMPLDMEVGLGPGDFVLDGNPVPPPKEGTASPKRVTPPNFRPMFVVAKRLPISATADLLFVLTCELKDHNI